MARIFVSSTSKDLKECREKVNENLRKMNHEDIAMEHYVAEDKRPLDKCQKDVASSALYIGIFAWRYGYVPDGQDKSITELEYRKAVGAGKECLIFLLDEDVPWPPKYIDRGKNEKRIKALRDELSKKYVVNFFKSADELASLVGAAVHNWEMETAFKKVETDRRDKPPSIPTSPLEFSIQSGDVTLFKTDVLALKYAQGFHGTDKIVSDKLIEIGIDVRTLQPKVGKHEYIETRNCIQADHALFIGVPDLTYFNYQDIQIFATNVLQTLVDKKPPTRHLAMTIHGANCGLDEIEAFLVQFKGYLDALQSEQFPKSLEKITIIDKNLERVKRLREAFEENFSYLISQTKETTDGWTYQLNINIKSNHWFSTVCGVITPKVKPNVFVTMTINDDLDDLFHNGIQTPARKAGFYCENFGQEAFTWDLEYRKRKIETATVVIAELTGENPNVYLEVGYALGKGRPTLLLVKNEQELPSDVRDQKYLQYKSTEDLEKILNTELNNLKPK